MPAPRHPSSYATLAAATVPLALLLIGMGAVVRATGSGLGCPDWPLCHGGVLPFDDTAATIEWTHRLLAMVVGAAVVALAGWTLWRERTLRAAVVGIGLLALLAVQAYLGREAVLRELPPEVVAAHLGTALLLVAVLVWMAVIAWMPERPTPAPSAWRVLTLLTAGAVLVAVALGAMVVVDGAALACSGWPGCPEASVPLLFGDRIQDVQWLHRLAVSAGLLLVVASTWAAYRWHVRAVARRITVAMLLLYLGQGLVGAFNVWWELPAGWRALHVLLANTVWTLAVLNVAVAWLSPRADCPAKARVAETLARGA